MRQNKIQHRFVEFIPTKLDAGKLYISIEYATSAHLCCCGCGHEVVSPLTPMDWSLTYNGESVSLAPSIGNSNFPCKSHYWIRNNRVAWEAKMTPRLTAASRARDKAAKARRFGESLAETPQPSRAARSPTAQSLRDGWLARLRRLLS